MIGENYKYMQTKHGLKQGSKLENVRRNFNHISYFSNEPYKFLFCRMFLEIMKFGITRFLEIC